MTRQTLTSRWIHVDVSYQRYAFGVGDRVVEFTGEPPKAKSPRLSRNSLHRSITITHGSEMVDGVVSLPSGHQAFRTPSKPVIDIPRSYDTGHSTQFHRSMSTAIRQQSLHRSSQHRLQPTEPQLTRQRLRPVLSQTIGHPRRRLQSAVVCVSEGERLCFTGIEMTTDDCLCLRPCPKSLRLESRLRVYRVLTGDTDGLSTPFSSSSRTTGTAQIPDDCVRNHPQLVDIRKIRENSRVQDARFGGISSSVISRDSSSSESSPPNLSSLAASTS